MHELKQYGKKSLLLKLITIRKGYLNIDLSKARHNELKQMRLY